MKNFKKLKLIFIISLFSINNVQAMTTEDDVKHAKFLVRRAVFSPLLHWQTVEYFGGICVANSFNPTSLRGELALYPEQVSDNQLASTSHRPGYFSKNAPTPPLHKMSYMYVSEKSASYFRVRVLPGNENHTIYNTISIQYFIKKFALTHTNAKCIFIQHVPKKVERK